MLHVRVLAIPSSEPETSFLFCDTALRRNGSGVFDAGYYPFCPGTSNALKDEVFSHAGSLE